MAVDAGLGVNSGSAQRLKSEVLSAAETLVLTDAISSHGALRAR